MGKEEILNILDKNPRLCGRELAEELNQQLSVISKHINKLINSKEVQALFPTEKELERIMKSFPNSVKKAKYKLKVYEVKNK